MKPKILVVEDEPTLAEVLCDYLAASGFDAHSLADGNQVIAWVQQHQPAAVTLDVMLPGKDGFQLLKEIRQFSQVPVLMISARVDEIDRLLGLELHADDYICKPFSAREVVARIKTVLRRQQQMAEIPAPATTFILDRERLCVRLREQEQTLTQVEFELLACLMARPGRIVSRSHLMDTIYPDRRIVSDRTIDSHVKKLRKKLALLQPETELIGSIYGAGYKFDDSALSR
ncbi:response regulator [Simiduia agarivorans]|uniref:DNA-binding response regulator n=1 Tax=Simiduia agarivorans (strain DSM 21679 / JCM 13881 / BCRC 17597 / SA1) TaxID=1117647 RepID=K4KMF2_SIMAS|nr:response regulator [Simiduia agarivorans]AFU99258.1 DNA-binding response regulator [Simiduia agarivorans SA1 = DSM 21679]